MGIARSAKAQCKAHLKAKAPRLYTLSSRAWRRVRARKFARYQWVISLYGGPALNELAPLYEVFGPILTRDDINDVSAEFVADPFMVSDGDRWYLFFEIANLDRGKGEIGLATSTDLRSWDYQGVIISESYHLSYPYVFSHAGHWYMIPETGEAGGVLLYEADEFPRRWSVRKRLLGGDMLLDPSAFHFDGQWWMFVDTSGNDRSDTLSLFHAEELTGPWGEHPCSPVVGKDPTCARPAGRVVQAAGRPIRFAQNCSGEYGAGVTAFEVTDLSIRSYSERSLGTVLAPRDGTPYRNGMHHIDAVRMGSQWLACVDGR